MHIPPTQTAEFRSSVAAHGQYFTELRKRLMVQLLPPLAMRGSLFLLQDGSGVVHINVTPDSLIRDRDTDSVHHFHEALSLVKSDISKENERAAQLLRRQDVLNDLRAFEDLLRNSEAEP